MRVKLFFVLVTVTTPCFAQTIDSVRVAEHRSLLAVVRELEADSSVKFYYLEQWLTPFTVSSNLDGRPLAEILSNVLAGSDVNVAYLYNYVIFYKDPNREIEREGLIDSIGSRKGRVKRVAIGDERNRRHGQAVKVEGVVADKASGEGLAGVTVYVYELDLGVQTGQDGKFEFVLPSEDYLFSFHLLNYEEVFLQVGVYEDGALTVEMNERPIMLDEIVIASQSKVDEAVGKTTIELTSLARSPTFLGERDIVRTLQTQPGVVSVSEANSGFNVRGGSVDQNLVLFDGVPVFNSAHALGFFTAFNSDIIRDVSFYKGGIPAEFGGRASSVLSMTSKEGSMQKWGGSAGLGLVANDLMVGGPVVKNRSSVMFSFRSTYSDWLLRQLKRSYNDIHEGSVSFYDGSAKYTLNLRNKHKLTIASYFSKDRFRLASDTINRWNTITGSVRYDGYWGDDFYSLGIATGNYGYRVTETEPLTAFDLTYGIFYPSVHFDVIRDQQFRKTSLGFRSTLYSISPGTLIPGSDQSNAASIKMDIERSLESAVYISHSFVFQERFHVDAGLRLSMFNRIGPGWVFRYKADSPQEPRNVTDSLFYGSGRIIKTYVGPEPRLGLRYPIGDRASIKFGYNRLYQYVHLVSNTAAVTPVDIWQSSNTYFRPQVADQVSIGYFLSGGCEGQKWNAFAEAYFKQVENVLDFKDGADLILNRKLEVALLPGIGKSYGIEISLAKEGGHFEGDLNYTYSRSQRRVDGNFTSEKINQGHWYAANYDQPHVLNANWRYQLRRHVYFSGAFTYHTGRPISVPIAAYEIGDAYVIDFSERNNFRLPDYHRLDIALVIEGSNRKRKWMQAQWTAAVYNLYGRRNPYAAFFDYNTAGAVKPKQISLIGIPVPSITYGIKF